MRSVIVAILVFAAAIEAAPKWNQLEGYTFRKYVDDFNKKYNNPAEYALREKIFNTRLTEIREHNADRTQLYRKGVNHLTDLTEAEFQGMLGGRPRAMGHLASGKNRQTFKPTMTSSSLPRQVDYRNSIPSILTAVKDQGNCGSCWAHGSTECVESMHAIKTGDLYVLSQQQLVSCAPNPNDCGGTGGCLGSTAELAYEYLISAGGQAQEWTYPYTSYNGANSTCAKKIVPAVKVTGYTRLPANDQYSVMQALATVGPLAINVDASQWNTYESGIYTGCNYAKNITIDHVVQLVGYGHDDDLNVDYWIVRNSWSPAYGEHGFIRLFRQSQPACGWDTDAQEGTACKGQPSYMWACGECGILMDVSYPIV